MMKSAIKIQDQNWSSWRAWPGRGGCDSPCPPPPPPFPVGRAPGAAVGGPGDRTGVPVFVELILQV